jgi:hypothetical protein
VSYLHACLFYEADEILAAGKIVLGEDDPLDSRRGDGGEFGQAIELRRAACDVNFKVHVQLANR